MKRHGQLMPKIADADNLRLAFWKAAKGKRGKADCLTFREHLDENLAALGVELIAGEVPVGDYHYFKVRDPKERLICAATFRERVLHHALKANTAINRTAFGMDFLGYRLFPGTVRLARRSKVRFSRKFRRYQAAQRCGRWSELILQQRMQALLAFVLPAESGAFRRHVLQRFGVTAKRLQPCESGRQLEQQRDQLPDGESQQQQPGQQQQQHWVPIRFAPSSTLTPEGIGADPAAILSGANAYRPANTDSQPPGASRQTEFSEDSGRNYFPKILH